MKKKILFALLVSWLAWPSYSQNERKITLPEAIALARVQSVDAAVALNELKTSYWEYRTFRADLLPEVNFTGTLPNYNKSYTRYQQEDGSYTFVRNNSLGISGELSIDQNIWFTGGKLSVSSSLDYIKQMGANGKEVFMSIPIGLKLTQPIFGVNHLKWSRRIEPVKYEEAKAGFITATEEVTMRTINYFFNLLLAKENLGTAKQNEENANRLYEVAVAKRRMGQISENELLQLKLASLKAQASLTEAESNLNANMFQLRAFLGLSETEILEPVLPQSAPALRMEYNDVLDKALQRNSFAQNIRRRQLEADYSVATAKGNMREINLYASVGYTGQDKTLSSSYRNLLDNQVIEVGVTIPLLDWGKRRGKVKVAESNREVVLSRIRQEQMNFNQDIFLLVEKFNNQLAQLTIADEADQIAQKRYKTSIETFLIGKINTLDLNDAQTSKDDARQKHIQEMFYYWYYYYQLRSLTLWDFERNTQLEVDFKMSIEL
ncbi:TolC family protein [Bacteroides sp. 519]|uniref:TolC family protein n=1 Tax=Bacteroides sp. 519 TaxID=2302937 RepID=UPI0013D6A454|nr:TolC family protein [Bacteroides sp. 519]NDV60247.1 TolC family protein [Bacteroides sp. 519]